MSQVHTAISCQWGWVQCKLHQYDHFTPPVMPFFSSVLLNFHLQKRMLMKARTGTSLTSMKVCRLNIFVLLLLYNLSMFLRIFMNQYNFPLQRLGWTCWREISKRRKWASVHDTNDSKDQTLLLLFSNLRIQAFVSKFWRLMATHKLYFKKSYGP